MTTESLVALTAIVLAFIVFAATLFWAETQTRDIKR